MRNGFLFLPLPRVQLLLRWSRNFLLLRLLLCPLRLCLRTRRLFPRRPHRRPVPIAAPAHLHGRGEADADAASQLPDVGSADADGAKDQPRRVQIGEVIAERMRLGLLGLERRRGRSARAGRLSVTAATGSGLMTQTSAALPPCCMAMAEASSDAPMRAKPPPGTAKQPSKAGIPWHRIILAVYTAMAAA